MMSMEYPSRKLYGKLEKKASASTKQNVIKPRSTEFNGYYGFKLYFINDDGLNVEKTFKNVSTFQEYINRHSTHFDLSEIRNNKVFFVNLTELVLDNEFKCSWIEFISEIVTNTEYCLSCMGLAMHQTIINAIKEDGKTNHRLPIINARITNHQPILNLKNLKVNYFSKLVSIRGTVIKANNARMLGECIQFDCSSCGGSQFVKQLDGLYSFPTKCPTRCCRAQSNFTRSLTSSQTLTVDWQTLKLQEMIEIDGGENGRVPRTIECELMDDLVGCCIPGDDLTITGIVKVRSSMEVPQKKNHPSMFSLYVHAISAVNNKNEDQAIGNVGRVTFNTNDYYAIQAIHAEPKLFRFLVHSLCPQIYGNEMVKAGLLLALFRGTPSDEDTVATRDVSHVLMVGDPGLGKSQMLQACTNVAPKGVYVCGNTSTGAGLTVTMSKEANGDYSLEAGALILADEGTCCIDEFDKMTNQHSCLLEAMEQQSISIAKAGITCNLVARTSILAAANPSGGHYNKAKTVSENIKMSSPLISRFDLVFLLLDRPCERYDHYLSEHVLALHSGQNNRSFTSLTPIIQTTNNSKLENRLKLECEEEIDHLPHQLLRKYIAYAQKYVHPTISPEAQTILKEFFLELRKHCQANSCSPVTTRQLESLQRLTQARAKVELREEATAEDAKDVVEIMRHALYDVFSDETGKLDLTRSQNGTGFSKQKLIKAFLSSLQRNADDLKQSVFSKKDLLVMAKEVGIDKDRFSDILQTLNINGYLLKKSVNTYQFASVD